MPLRISPSTSTLSGVAATFSSTENTRRIRGDTPTIEPNRSEYPSSTRCLLPDGVIVSRVPPSFGAIEAIDEQSCWFDTGASTFENLAMHLVLLGADFVVDGPPELVEQVGRLMDRYRRATEPVTG